MKILTDKDVFKKEGLYKFVRVNGIYRFVSVNSCFPPKHKDMLQGDEKAESAGTVGVMVGAKYWKVYDSYSDTVKVGIKEEDEKRLSEIFGCPLKEDY